MTRTIDRYTDVDLLHAIACDRDRAAFAELARRYQQDIYHLACRITGRQDLALEAAQESLVRLWRAADRFRNDGNVRGWILKVVARESLVIMRSKRRRATIRVRESQRMPPAAAAAPDAAAEKSELLNALHTMLDRLAPPERQLVALYYGAGLSQDEIASELDVPQRTVSFRIQKALDVLRGHLREAGFAAAGASMAEGLPDLLTQAVTSGGPVPLDVAHMVEQAASSSPVSHAAKYSARRSIRAAAVPSSSAGIWVAAVLVIGAVAAYAVATPAPQASRSNPDPTVAESPSVQPAPPKDTPAPLNPYHRTYTFENGLPEEISVPLGHYAFKAFARGERRFTTAQNEEVILLLPEWTRADAFEVVVSFTRIDDNGRTMQIGGGRCDGERVYSYRKLKLPYDLSTQDYETMVLSMVNVDDYILCEIKGRSRLLSELRDTGDVNRPFLNVRNIAIRRIEVRSLLPDEARAFKADIEKLKKDAPQALWVPSLPFTAP